MRWVDRFQEEEEIKRHNRKPIAYKIHKDQVKFLLAELQKIARLTDTKLKENINKVLREIPKDKYTNIFKGAYNRDTKYVKKPSWMIRKLKYYKV
jgi:DNA-directed RNA polymerase beta' subunit